MYKLEKEIKVITELRAMNIDSEFTSHYKLNFPLEEISRKIRDYFSKKK
ncbi:MULTISPECIES: plasmid maintenance protein [Borreliella]